MTYQKFCLPYAMGTAMGLMMLWMAHGALVQGGSVRLGALAGFAALHVVVLGGLMVVAFWAARYAPAFKRRLDKLHRPSLSHVLKMLCSAAGAALVAHVCLHGGF